MKKCIYCNSNMLLDDFDYNFKGNQDNYWKCENCGTTAFEKIRFNKSIFTEFERGII